MTRRAFEYPLLQRYLLVVWVAWTKDEDLICADWASEMWLTTYTTLQQFIVLPATKYSIRAINCHHSRVNGAQKLLPQETTKLPFLKKDSEETNT